MSTQERIAVAARRIATATSVIRTRGEDKDRAERHGEATNGVVVARKLERLASQLESLIA